MQLMQQLTRDGLLVYEKSYVCIPQGEAVMVRKNDQTLLAVNGSLSSQFHGTDAENGYLLCPTDHENRLVLNEYFSFTKPVSFGREAASFGFGDRLGYANPAQIRAIANTPLRPVLAQQSVRELSLAKRTNVQVIDAAAWAVFREGYTKGYASDGDHLKSFEEISAALQDGCTMITVDCSLVLKSCSEADISGLDMFSSLPEEVQAAYRSSYLSNQVPPELDLHFSESLLYKLHTIYHDALELIHKIYVDLLLPAGRPIDLEVSLDETVETTSLEAHYFVGNEMQRMGVIATSLAPKFVGEFQKAIDYIGDLKELEQSMYIHARIADHFGYKLSLHSGSEKYSVLPILAAATHGRYHVKTSGTSWLEVVETIAKHAPALYRKMHRVALEHIEEAKNFYVVHCNTANIRPLDQVADEDLPSYLELGQNDSRQLMHITYGFILDDPTLKSEIIAFLEQHASLYEHEIEELFHRHLALLVPDQT